MPFISEEIWQNIKERESNDYVIVAEWPKAAAFDKNIISAAEVAFELISNIRNIRNSNGISFKNKLNLYAKVNDFREYAQFQNIISRLGNLDTFEECKENPENSISFTIRADEFFIPADGNVDVEKEKTELTKELEYTQGFLNSITKKLSNERFVNNAPEQVVAVEKKKQADAEEKIKMLAEKLKGLG